MGLHHDRQRRESGPDNSTPIEVYMYLSDLEGNQILEKNLDTSKEEGLNYWYLGESCMMAYSAQMKTLALHCSRTMNQ